MIPRHYLDFILAEARGDGDAPLPVLAGAVLKVLHGAFSQTPGTYALALPGRLFGVLRVFTAEREHLDALVAAVEQHAVIRDYVRLGYPRQAPEAFTGAYVEYRRFRIPSRRSGRKPDDDLRERRMAQADARKLPFFILQSRSNGQRFGLYVERRVGAPGSEAQPDAYGFSVASRPFAVPDLP